MSSTGCVQIRWGEILIALVSFVAFVNADGEPPASRTCPAVVRPDQEGPFYIANVPPFTNVLASDDEIAESKLFVEGRVYGRDCVPIANVQIEPWYAGGDDAEYSSADSDLTYRGNFVSDKCGYYNYTQTFPAVYPGRDILHVHFKFTLGSYQLTTQMYFQGHLPAKYENYLIGRETQIVEVDHAPNGVKNAVFDVVLGIDGTSSDGACSPSSPTQAPVLSTSSPSASPSLDETTSPTKSPQPSEDGTPTEAPHPARNASQAADNIPSSRASALAGDCWTIMTKLLLAVVIVNHVFLY